MVPLSRSVPKRREAEENKSIVLGHVGSARGIPAAGVVSFFFLKTSRRLPKKKISSEIEIGALGTKSSREQKEEENSLEGEKTRLHPALSYGSNLTDSLHPQATEGSD